MRQYFINCVIYFTIVYLSFNLKENQLLLFVHYYYGNEERPILYLSTKATQSQDVKCCRLRGKRINLEDASEKTKQNIFLLWNSTSLLILQTA